MKKTVKNVADRAGVSKATAARILGGYAGLNSRSYEKVWSAAKEIGYVPNHIAKSLASKKTQKLGIILPDIENLFFAKLFRGIESISQANEYTLALRISGEHAEKEKEMIYDLLTEQVDGLIIASSDNLDGLKETLVSVPIVSVDRMPRKANCSWISSDNYQSAYNAIKHLKKRNYQKVSLITNLSHLSPVQERVEGASKAAVDYQVALTHYCMTSYRLEEMVEEMKSFLLTEKPEALLVTDAIICMAVLLCTKELSIQIGNDLGLLSYDEEAWMNVVTPSITAIKQPAVEMGKEAAEILISQINQEKPLKIGKRLASTLIIRDSTARTFSSV